MRYIRILLVKEVFLIVYILDLRATSLYKYIRMSYCKE